MYEYIQRRRFWIHVVNKTGRGCVTSLPEKAAGSSPPVTIVEKHRPMIMISKHRQRYIILMRLTERVTVVRIESVFERNVRVVRAAVEVRLVATVLHVPVGWKRWKCGGPDCVSE